MSDDDRYLDEDGEDWRLPPAFCDNYTVHDGHTYRAINTNWYRCDGLSEEDLAEIEAADALVCEHGMSLQLCAGPQHYPLDM